MDYLSVKEEHDACMREVANNKSKVALWSNPYDAYSRNQYYESKAYYKNSLKKLNSLQTKLDKLKSKMKEEIQAPKEFAYYAVAHSFRARNNAGMTIISYALLFVDKNVTEVVAFFTDEEGKLTQYGNFLKNAQEMLSENPNADIFKDL